MRKLFFTILLSLMTLSSNAQMIKLGDINRDNQVNINDVMTLVDIILNGYSPFSVSPTDVTMQVGGTANVTIFGGYYIYDVASENPDIVTATLNGLTVTLTAVAGGETTVTVKDVLTFRTIDIPVVVNYESLQVSTNELSLIAGARGTVEINSGSGYYSVHSSDANVATASVSGGTVTVTAVGAGEATVTITDIKTGQMAVVDVKVGYIPIALSSSSLGLSIGDESRVSVTSGSGSYEVQSSDANVATAVMDGSSVVVTAVGAGTATITVTDRRSGQTATIEVTVEDNQPQSYLPCPDDHHPHLIDLGLPSGTKWACCNVDTDHPENQSPTNYGGYYAWGETETKSTYSWSSYIHCDGSYDTCHDLGDDIAGTEYDVAHVKWGGFWVMPSKEQQDELRNNCTYEWTTVNGVKGGKFTSKTNGGSIFLPAAGYRYGSRLGAAGSYGYYWSSTQGPMGTHRACYLYFYSGGTGWGYDGRDEGRSVRPVVRN